MLMLMTMMEEGTKEYIRDVWYTLLASMFPSFAYSGTAFQLMGKGSFLRLETLRLRNMSDSFSASTIFVDQQPTA
jgi:hypothetical protein